MQLAQYNHREFSQFTEDGITLELVRRLDPPHFFVEIGCGDGSENNTRVLAERKWSGLWIDSSNYTAINLFPWVNVRCAHMDIERAAYYVRFAPREFGVLSIDVDGMDYHLWKAFCEYAWKPWIVIIEAQIQKPFDEPYVQPYDETYAWDHETKENGASIFSLTELGKELGYECLGKCPDEGSPNLFFVRADLMGRLGE